MATQTEIKLQKYPWLWRVRGDWDLATARITDRDIDAEKFVGLKHSRGKEFWGYYMTGSKFSVRQIPSNYPLIGDPARPIKERRRTSRSKLLYVAILRDEPIPGGRRVRVEVLMPPKGYKSFNRLLTSRG